MLADSLYKKLTSDAGVSALVSTRVYPLLIPQQVYDEVTKQPCLVYTIDTDARGITFGGSENLIRARVQIDCYAKTFAASQNLAAAVRDCLIDLSGVLTDNASPVGSVNVQHTFLDGELSSVEEDPGLYRVLQRYVVWYDE